MSKFKTCGSCGSHLDHGERCGCEDTAPKSPSQPQTLTLTFSDGDTTTTRFNGCQQAAIGHYTANNYLERKNPVVSILFNEAGNTVELPYTN